MRAVILTTLLATLPAGCNFGPRVIEKTHGKYAESVRKVQEEQVLRQFVLLRYNEISLSLDISSIAAQYQLSAGAEARPFFGTPNPAGNIFHTYPMVLPDLTLSTADRPTVSLTPIDDGSSVRRYLTPITLDTLVFLTQTSWPVSTVMRIWVERINGVPNAVTASGPPREITPDYERFLRITQLLQVIQDRELAAVQTSERWVEVGGPFAAEAVTPAAAVEAVKAGLEYRAREDGKLGLMKKERRLVIEVSPGADNSPEITELATRLKLVPGRKTYDITVSARGRPDPEKFPSEPADNIHIVPRSIAQAIYYLSNGVEVPVEHMCEGLVRPMVDAAGKPFDPTELTRGLFSVHVCKGHKPPPEAYVAIRYRGYWYYIDDTDADTKATFALMLHLSRLDFARQQIGAAAPTLTLPVGR
jgi:hypothetical protein